MKAIRLIIAAAFVSLVACSNNTTATAENAAEATEEAAAKDAVIELAAGTTELPSAKTVIFIDFNADWCGPCQRFKPIYEKVAGETAGKAMFISVNTDSCPDIAEKYNISSIPQVIAVKTDGTAEYAPAGYMDYDKFNEFVQKQL